MSIRDICVIGTGNGSFALAADLSLKGLRITLWDDPLFLPQLEPLMRKKEITIDGAARNGLAHLYRVTANLAEALEGVDVVLVPTPSFAHADTAKKLAPVIRPGMKVFLCAGSTGGALEFAKIFRDQKVPAGVKLAEFSTLPYGAKKTGPASVNVATLVQANKFAAFPAKDTQELLADAQSLFGGISPARDVLECSLGNGNIVLHGPVMLMNAAGTEGNPDNYHYRHGITPSIGRAMEKIDAERLAVARQLGYRLSNVSEGCVQEGYCPKLEATLYDTIRGSGDLMHSKGPNTLEHRYLTEDIPCSALVVSEVGRMVGASTPLIDAMITLCGALMERDYWREGRTAEKLGIAGMDARQLIAFLQCGYQ